MTEWSNAAKKIADEEGITLTEGEKGPFQEFLGEILNRIAENIVAGEAAGEDPDDFLGGKKYVNSVLELIMHDVVTGRITAVEALETALVLGGFMALVTAEKNFQAGK